MHEGQHGNCVQLRSVILTSARKRNWQNCVGRVPHLRRLGRQFMLGSLRGRASGLVEVDIVAAGGDVAAGDAVKYRVDNYCLFLGAAM
jgi:hypothetical protein